MATNKEKQLATLLLKERLERLTGKKVVLKEGGSYEDELETYQDVANKIVDIMSNIEDTTDALNHGSILSCKIYYKGSKFALEHNID